jgi:hypothetical protein
MIKWRAENLTNIRNGTILLVHLKKIRKKIAFLKKIALDPHVDPDPTPDPPFFSLNEK